MFEEKIWAIFDKYEIGKHEDESCVLAVHDISELMMNLRNELCLKCGNYSNDYCGNCDWCKYKLS